MKRKLLILFLTCVVGWLSPLNAQTTVEVGSASEYSNNLPSKNYYKYTMSQQIYTATEVGIPSNAEITSIAFNLQGVTDDSRTLTVYLKNTDKSSFDSSSDFVALNETDKFYSGEVALTTGWVTINFTKSFEYAGGNIIVGVTDDSGDCPSSGNYYYTYTTTDYTSIIQYSDGSPYDMSSPSSANGINEWGSNYNTFKNNIKLTYTNAGGSDPSTPEPGDGSIDLTKQYRVKVSSGTGQDNYLTVFGYSTNSTTNMSSVGVSQYAENNMQIFTIEESGNGNYYLKDQNGYYIICGYNDMKWNVDAVSTTNKTALAFDGYTGGTSTFYIRDSELTGDKTSSNNYFKVNSYTYNGSYKGYLVYCDAPQGDAVTWTLEEVPPLSAVNLSAAKSLIYTDETVSITATTTGGITPFTYDWSATPGSIEGNGQTVTFIPTSVGPSDISCSVTDAKGVTVVSTVTITVDDAANKPKGEVGVDATNYSEIPGYNYYNYSISQQIYTKDELNIPEGSYINSISFRLYSKTQDARNWSVYLLNTDKESFTSYSDFVSVTTDALFTGDVTFGDAGGWFKINFTKDFVYEGNNILVCITDNKGSYNYGSSSNKYYGITTEVKTAILNYNDNNSYVVANPTIGNYYKHENFKNSVKFGYAAPSAFPLELSAGNTSVCKNDAVELTATVDGTGTYTYTWTVTEGSGEFSNAEATTYFTPSSAGNCVIKCSVNDGTNTVEKEITLTVYDMPKEFTIDNQNITINSAQTATFTIIYTGNMPSTVSDVINNIQTQYKNNDNEDPDTMFVTTKKLYENTEITYKVSNSNSPWVDASSSYLCSVEKTVNITVNPTFYVTLEANTENVCDNGSVTLTATPHNHNTEANCEYAWSVVEGKGSGTFSQATSQTTTFTPAGIENVASQTMKLQCTAYDGTEIITDTIEVYVYDVPELNLDKTTYYVTSGETVTIDVKCPEYCSLDYDYYLDSHSNFNPGYASTDDGIQLTYVVEEDRDIELSLSNQFCSSEKVKVSLKVINENKEVEIGTNENLSSRNYLPVKAYNKYSITQQIYTAEELGIKESSQINSISFYATWCNTNDRNIDVYLVETTNDAFSTTTDFVNMLGTAIPNFSGSVEFVENGWTTIPLKSFTYEPGTNILVCVNDKTGSSAGGEFEFGHYSTTEARSIVRYGDAQYDATNIDINSGNTTDGFLNQNNHIKLGYQAIDQAELVAEINAVSDTTLCNGENDNRFEMYATKVENATYKWYIGKELLDERREITYKKSNPGTDTIRLVVTQNDVSKEDTKVLTINPMPSAELAMENTYVGVETKFTFPDDNEGVTYTVTFTRIENNVPSTAYNVKNAERYDFYKFNETGTYKMDVVANSNSLCESSQDEVAFITVYPAADFIADNLCAGSGNVTTFNNTTAYVGGQVFTWDFGDGSEPLVSNESTVTHKYPIAGDYNVKLTVENGTSSNVKAEVISINAAPIITDITLSKTIVIDEVTFTAKVTGAESESWKVNGTPIVGNKYVFDTADDYTITVTATSSTGCTSEYSKPFHINDKSSAPIVNGNQSLTEIDLGFRPVQSWMRPIDIKITPDGSKALRINSITIDDKGDEDTFGEVVDLNYLKFTSEVGAYEVEPGSSLDLKLTHDVDNEYLYRDAFSETGTGNYYTQESASLTIYYGGGEEYNITLKYKAYPPVTGDVVEFPHVVTFNNGTYTKEDNSGVIANYLLPGYDGEYYDAVYKIVLDKSMAITATVTGTNGRAYIYDATFGGEGGPGMTNFIGYEEVRGAAATEGDVADMMLEAGTYYLVAASESANFSVNITSTEFGEPLQAANPSPGDNARGMSTELNELQWTFGKYTAEYQVMFGTEQPLDILLDWNADIDNNSCALNSTLSPNTLYYWQVNAKNDVGTTTGTVWNFATKFDKVQNLAVTPEEISVGGTSKVTWTAVTPGSITGYNVLADGVKVNNKLITGTTYTITTLGYKAEAYNITVQAVYNIDGYEIYSDSEPVKLYVLGNGQVDGYVYAEDGEAIEGASVTFGTKTFTTGDKGYYSGTVTAGTYNAIARKSGYKKSSISNVSVPYNGLKSQDFILPYNLTMAENVVAVENGGQTAVDVTWDLSSEGGPMFENFENGFTYKWETSEEYPWEVVLNGYDEESAGYASFGRYCVKSTNSDYDYDQLTGGSDDGKYKYENTTSFLELTVNVPFDDTISFYYRISADVYSYDHGIFYIDEALVDIFGGNKTWSSSNYVKYAVKAGTHTFRWEYFKDNGNYYNEDAFFIDNISFYKNTNLYNVYRRDILLTEKDTIAENLTVKELEDTDWADEDFADGIYQWGVSVLYNDAEKDLLNEDFEVITNDTLKELGKFGGPQGEYTYVPDAANVIVRSIESKNDYYQNGNSGYYYTITTYYGYDRDVNEEPLNNDWSQSDGSNWVTGIYSENTSASGIAAKGYNKDESESAPVTSIFGMNIGDSNGHYYLISPKIDASMQSYLEFDYIIPQYSEGEDWSKFFNKFRVVYRTTPEGPWEPLTDYNTEAVNDWTSWTSTQPPIELPLESELYIAFENYDSEAGLGVGLDNVRVYSEGRSGKSKIAWSNLIGKGNELIYPGNWSSATCWSRSSIPNENEVAIIKAAGIVEKVDAVTADAVAKAVLVDNGRLTINETGVLTASTVIDSVAADITINAGGQLVHNNKGVMATFVKNIAAYTSESDGWYTISSPLATNVNASDVTNLLSGEFDLYRYDEPTHYWENYEDNVDAEGPDNTDWDNNSAVIEKGRGYLYANSAATELSFVGELNTTQVSRTLSAQADALTGFNLLGNPFAHNIYKGVAFAKGGELRTGYYTLDNHGAWQASTDNDTIKSGAGFLVQTDVNATEINIDKVNAAPQILAEAMLAVAVVNDRYEDVAYVTFNEGLGLEKIGHMNENIPMVYVPSNFNSFAIATVEEDVTEIPVNFEAMTMGEYTIGVKAENCEYKVMTLVDNLTGVETNLLKDSYTFMATTTDDPDRFLIKLSKDNEEVADSFIYINNGELIFDNLSNDAIINVFDVLGRNVATFNNCGDTTYRVSTDLFADGVYMVRLIEGNNVKVQKMVIE